MVPKIERKPIIGRQLFDIVTSGMYDNPMMIYREYIQNSVDSIDLAIKNRLIKLEEAKIAITVNGHERNIVIEDNGQGLRNDEAHSILTDLGHSPKEGTNQRGFRGIGRLGGLAYCDELIFKTRSLGDEFVSIVRWNRKEFDTLANDSQRNITLTEMIQAVVTHELEKATTDTPAHFFTVILRNVHRFHSDMLMNVKALSDYLAQVAPVPYNRQVFTFADSIEDHISPVKDYRSYQITVNDRQLFRPYSNELKLSTNAADQVKVVEYFKFKGTDTEVIAYGWYANTNFLATMPTALNIKGIRVRQGNIAIGDGHYLDDKFSEPRFSGWQIGEIHIVNGSLKPNARRDGFEHTANFEKFLEQSNLLGRHLSRLCRKASNQRVANAKVKSSLLQLEKLLHDPKTYVDEEHHQRAIHESQVLLANIEKISTDCISDALKEKLILIKSKMANNHNSPIFLEDILDGRKLRKFTQKSLLKHVVKTIINNCNHSMTPEDILQQIFMDFTKPSFMNRKASNFISQK